MIRLAQYAKEHKMTISIDPAKNKAMLVGKEGDVIESATSATFEGALLNLQWKLCGNPHEVKHGNPRR